MEKTVTLHVSAQGQTTLPIQWRRKHGMLAGGAIKVSLPGDPEGSLLLTPIRENRPKVRLVKRKGFLVAMSDRRISTAETLAACRQFP
ncbi:MAG: hypothetical protein ABSC03_08185 [Verrucomicrobiota bacterium]|jgi:bifunctional DNA-binding transcriptional regulator/antitoxin component of YhaV-PrlF toxin-antitoxin module